MSQDSPVRESSQRADPFDLGGEDAELGRRRGQVTAPPHRFESGGGDGGGGELEESEHPLEAMGRAVEPRGIAVVEGRGDLGQQPGGIGPEDIHELAHEPLVAADRAQHRATGRDSGRPAATASTASSTGGPRDRDATFWIACQRSRSRIGLVT